MWFRNKEGKLIEIVRKHFYSDTHYNTFIMNMMNLKNSNSDLKNSNSDLKNSNSIVDKITFLICN